MNNWIVVSSLVDKRSTSFLNQMSYSEINLWLVELWLVHSSTKVKLFGDRDELYWDLTCAIISKENIQSLKLYTWLILFLFILLTICIHISLFRTVLVNGEACQTDHKWMFNLCNHWILAKLIGNLWDLACVSACAWINKVLDSNNYWWEFTYFLRTNRDTETKIQFAKN